MVPKNLHLKKMNPNIDLTDFPAASLNGGCPDDDWMWMIWGSGTGICRMILGDFSEVFVALQQ